MRFFLKVVALLLISSSAFAATGYDGMDSTPFDKTASTTGTGTSPSSGATTTTAQANEVLVGAIGMATNTAVGGSWSNSFNDGQSNNTTGGGASGNIAINEGYLEVSATGTYTAAKTGTTSADWEAVIATYKISGGGGGSPTVKTLSALGVG